MKALGISIATAIMLVLLTQGAMSITSQQSSLMEKSLSAATDRAGNAYVGDGRRQSPVVYTGGVDARVVGFSYLVAHQAACYAQIKSSPTITYTTVQTAVNKANAGDTVKVAGHCVGVESQAGVTQTVYISKNITLHGGYITTDWSTSDPAANPTTLNAVGQGRVLYITGDISVTVEGLGITGGDASGLGGDPGGYNAGGGVYITGSPTITLNNNQVFSNTAYLGGGLYLWNSYVTLNGNTVASNTVDGDGGGLYLRDAAATLNENAVTSNTAGLSGGGLFLFSSDAIFNGNAIVSNTAASGGGVFISQSTATFSQTGYTSVIARNIARVNGGGVCVEDTGRVTLKGGQIISNTAGQDGGGVYIAEGGGALTQTGVSVISNNRAKFGGGVYVVTGSVTLNGGQIISNSADNNGGGVFTWEGDVMLSGGQIISNSAAASGGGILIHNSNANFVQTGVSTITLNKADFGGGVYVLYGSATLEGGQIISNLAESAGGGVYVYSTTATFVQTGVSTIAHNTAVYGGGVYIMASRMTLSGGQIINNTAYQDGGGVYVAASDGAFTQTGVSIIFHNTAPYGGGVYVREGNATLSGGQILSNSAEINGGGMFVGDGSATLSGGQILSNSAEINGGGVHIQSSSAAFVQTGVSTITHNTADFGGGVYVLSGTATLSGGQISSNSAITDGGGIYAITDTLTISDSQIVSNTAQRHGGGLYLCKSDSTLINDVIADNLAGGVGSGLYIINSSPRLLHTTIARNGATELTAGSGGDGSGIYVTNDGPPHSTVALTNTILVRHAVGITVTTGNTATLTATLWGDDDWVNGKEWGGDGEVITSGNTWGDPDFVAPDASDYHIGPYSAAIDQGVPVSVNIDIDGDNRSIGSGPDLGADEFPAALRVNKQADPDLVQAGERLTYTILVTNSGNVNLLAAVTDTLPMNIAPDGMHNGQLISPGGVLTWTPTITASGGVWMETFVVTVEKAYVGPLVNVVRVTTNEGATGVYTGTSWVQDCYAKIKERPVITYPSVQAAVDAANAGETVMVAGYCAGVTSKTGATQTVYISRNITLRGGYTTTNWMQPDPEANPTTLNALRQGRVIYVTGDISATVEGLRITGGYVIPDDGGGIYNKDADLTLINTIIIGNAAYGDWPHAKGGGVYVLSGAATLNGGQIISNSAGQGGGVYVEDGTATLSGGQINSNTVTGNGGGIYVGSGSATLSESQIVGNKAKFYGGGVYVGQSTVALIQGSIISANRVITSGGGIYLASDAMAQVLDNQISGNTASSAGGGVYISGNAATAFHSNQVLSNTATKSGGGIYVGSGIQTPTIISNTVIGNTSWSTKGGGGGIYVTGSLTLIQGNTVSGNQAALNRGGGIYLTGGTTAQVIGNGILNNEAAKYGGGIYIRDSPAVIQSNYISANRAITDGGGIYLTGDITATVLDNYILDNEAYDDGGGVSIWLSGPYLENNIVAGNQAGDNGSGLYISGSSPRLLHTTVARNGGEDGHGIFVTSALTDTVYSAVAMTNTILVSHGVGIYVATDNTATLTATLWGINTWANDTNWDGDGTIITGSVNIWGDPDFRDPGAGDYHIGLDSAAIDTGVDAGVITDIDGDPRLMCHGFDVGADESMCYIYLPLLMRNWPPKPPTPTLQPIDNSGDDGNYTVEWDPITDTPLPIIAYTLEEDQVCDYGLVAPVEFDIGASTSRTFTNQKAGRYCYRVRARNNWGIDSDWSNEECVDVLWEHTGNDVYEQADGPLCSEEYYFGYPNNARDWFKFYHTGGPITVDLSNHTSEQKDLQLQLQYQQGNNPPKICDLAKCYRYEPPYSIEYNGPAGWYYVKLYIPFPEDYNEDTPYTLQMTFSQLHNQQR